MDLFAGFSWVGLLQIIGIDIILSGDNALVIALACRSLPPQQRRLGIWLGTGAAVVLRIAFAAAIVYLLMVPLLKLAGSMLLHLDRHQAVGPRGRGRRIAMASRPAPRSGTRSKRSSSPTR